jgi:hypothetical protein
MNAQTEALIEKVKSLPPEQRAEVEDFVDFLKARKDRARDAAAQRLGEAFAKLDALNLPPLTLEEVQASSVPVPRPGCVPYPASNNRDSPKTCQVSRQQNNSGADYAILAYSQRRSA